MSTKTSGTENRIVQEADPKTTKRAQWEAFEFELEAPGLIRVINGSHENPEDHSYRVNVKNDVPVACECPAFEYGNGPCKHMVAVAIREPVIEAADRPLMADGGQVSGNPYDDNGGLEGHEKALMANEIACNLMDIEGAGVDFRVFCALCKVVQDQIVESWEQEERRQTERAMTCRRIPREALQ